MEHDTKPYETPQVVESLDEAAVFGDASASPTAYGGSSVTIHEV